MLFFQAGTEVLVKPKEEFARISAYIQSLLRRLAIQFDVNIVHISPPRLLSSLPSCVLRHPRCLLPRKLPSAAGWGLAPHKQGLRLHELEVVARHPDECLLINLHTRGGVARPVSARM